jgi:hypothetical protein
MAAHANLLQNKSEQLLSSLYERSGAPPPPGHHNPQETIIYRAPATAHHHLQESIIYKTPTTAHRHLQGKKETVARYRLLFLYFPNVLLL